MHLRIFCVGIRQLDSTKRIFSESDNEKSIFHANMAPDLLQIVPGAMKKFNEIIAPKEELAKKDMHQEENLFFEAVVEVRKEICEKQQHNEKYEKPKKTISTFIKSLFRFH